MGRDERLRGFGPDLPMSQLDRDIKSAIDWLVSQAVQLAQYANQSDRLTSRILDKLEIVTECSVLPGDMPLRVRLLPRAFESRC
jgi:hypothetical protein